MAITFAASPDGLERGELERLLSGYVRTWPDGGHPLLRLVTQRDIETVYAEIAAILETIGASDDADIELVSGDIVDVTARGDCVVTADPDLAARVGARGRRPVEGFASPQPAGSATEELRGLLGYTSVVWGALLRGGSGYGDEARMFLRALDEAALEPIAQRINPEGPRADLSLDTERLLRRCEQRLVPASGSVNVLHMMPLGAVPPPGFRACRTMFETESVPPHWRSWLSAFDRIWVPTAFNVDSFERGGVPRERMRVLPGTIDFDRFHADAPPVELGETRGFTFVSNFDFQDRKGWDVLLRAYALEFAGEEDVTLLLKVHTIHTSIEAMEGRIAAELRRTGVPEARLPHIRIMAADLPESDLPGLYTAADAYVSPTRGEGWGRPLMEALACGTPVIASRWSAQLAFLDDDNAHLVDGHVVDVPDDVDIAVFRGQRWFDADQDALRAAMRAARSDPAAATARARAARPRLLDEFSRPAIAERIAQLTLEVL